MKKSNVSPIELITYLFVSKAFVIAKLQHPEITNEVDLLSYVFDLLKEANDRYELALETGQTDREAMHEIYRMFRIIERL